MAKHSKKNSIPASSFETTGTTTTEAFQRNKQCR